MKFRVYTTRESLANSESMCLEIEMIIVDYVVRVRSNHVAVCAPNHGTSIVQFTHVYSVPSNPNMFIYYKVVEMHNNTHAMLLCLKTAHTYMR